MPGVNLQDRDSLYNAMDGLRQPRSKHIYASSGML